MARQAGYKTLEINASDDRSAATVSTRIKNAIEAGSGLASDGKPTCVVIDEIDGASGGGDTVSHTIRRLAEVDRTEFCSQSDQVDPGCAGQAEK